MREFTLRVAGAAGAYASVQNNQTLKTKMGVSETDFSRARDDERDDIAQGVHDEALAVAGALADYGITQATLDALRTRIEAYRLAIASPSVARAGRRNATELLEAEFKRAAMICKERLDGVMLQFKESNAEFYNKYRAAREIIDTGHRKKTPATPEPPPPGP